MGTKWGYERGVWVETWVNSGNNDVSEHDTAQLGCQREWDTNSMLTHKVATCVYMYVP
jgi:hypothetical protein